jgi:hypothetical protein
MESTGVYWKPVLKVLEDDPQYPLKIVLAHLLRHAMLRPSFMPPRPIRELRDFTRRRKQMIGLAADERNRVQKVFEDVDVKIGDVPSDVFGSSGQLMPEASVDGLDDGGSARSRLIEGAGLLAFRIKTIWLPETNSAPAGRSNNDRQPPHADSDYSTRSKAAILTASRRIPASIPLNTMP